MAIIYSVLLFILFIIFLIVHVVQWGQITFFMRIDASRVCCYDEVIPKMQFLGMSYKNAKTKVTNLLKVKAVFPSLQPVGHSVRLYVHHLPQQTSELH